MFRRGYSGWASGSDFVWTDIKERLEPEIRSKDWTLTSKDGL